jgi:subtilisin family serine protease
MNTLLASAKAKMSQIIPLSELGLTQNKTLKLNPTKKPLTTIQGEITEPTYLFRVEAQENTDAYLYLGNLRTDLDFYLYKSNPLEDRSARPFASSSRPGTQDDQTFSLIKKREEIYIEIRKSPPISLRDNFNLCLQILVYPTGQNPNLTLPNDPLFNQQWHLFSATHKGQANGSTANLNFDLGAPEAWFFTTGTKKIPIAIIDTGVDNRHPDLKDNLWTNKAEKNGIKNYDDDQNGYIDDIHGWDFYDKNRNPLSWAPQLSGSGRANGDIRKHQAEITRSHGSHVAGIIGAKGNNGLGTSGINWTTSLMALNAANNDNMFTDNDIVEAIHYAIDNGAKVINMSLGSFAKVSPDDFKRPGQYNNYLDQTRDQYRKAFNKALRKDVLIVMAAGNNGQLGAETQGWKNIGNLDETSHSIHAHATKKHLDNILLVGSVDPDRRISSYSSYGKRVDLAAPGGNKEKPIFETDPITGQLSSTQTADYGIVSTVLSDRANDLETSLGVGKNESSYRSENGTSMAAPMVSGSAALIWGTQPSLGAKEIKNILLKSANKLDTLKPFIKGGKSLNLYKAMLMANNYDIDSDPENMPLCVPESL